MPSVVIGNTSKRINSTSQTFSGTSCSCILKEPCSMQRPVFRVQGLSKGSLYNYCSFEGRYYWVDDIVYVTNNIQDVYCHLDPLATYKSAITNTYGFIQYGDSTHWNPYVDDVRFAPEVARNVLDYEISLFPFTPSSTGCVVMTFAQTSSFDWTLNLSTQSPCGVHVGIMSVSSLYEAIGDLTRFGDTVPQDPSLITSIGEACLEIVQAFSRAMESSGGGSFLDNIKKCIWLPFELSSVVNALTTTQRQGLMIGGMLASNVTWYEVQANQIFTSYETKDITTNVEATTSNYKFLRNDRFLGMQFNTPSGCDRIPNDLALSPNGDIKFYFKTAFSIQDGSWAVKVSSTSSHRDTLTAFTGCVAVDLLGSLYGGPTPSSRIGQSIVAIETTAVSMGIGNIIGGFANYGGDSGPGSSNQNGAQGLMSMGSGITGAWTSRPHNCVVPTADYGGSTCGMFCTGSAGSTGNAAKAFLSIRQWLPKCILDSSTSYSDYCAKYGYPVNRYYKIGDITGYCQCVGASVEGASGASESSKSTINSYLNTGIYIE